MPGVGPGDQSGQAVPEHVQDAGLLTGDVRLDGLHQAGRVEGSDDGGGDALQEEVLAQQLQAGVTVDVLRPGGHLAQAVLHAQGEALDSEGAADTFPEYGAALPPVEVDEDREESEGGGVVPAGLHIDLALPPQDDEGVAGEVLSQEAAHPDAEPGVLVGLLLLLLAVTARPPPLLPSLPPPEICLALNKQRDLPVVLQARAGETFQAGHLKHEGCQGWLEDWLTGY